MDRRRIITTAQKTIPHAVRKALGLEPGDELAWEIEGDRVVITRPGPASTSLINNFSLFNEWASDADCKAFDNL